MTPNRRAAWSRSLRFRLLAATLAALAVALVLAGIVLAGLFREHVLRQFELALTAQLDQVTARLEFDADGRPQLDSATLSDPRWSRPYSGLYWQLDEGLSTLRQGVLRSRSLWDDTLVLPHDVLSQGAVHVHEVTGPEGRGLLAVERTVIQNTEAPADAGSRWRLVVAGDLQETAGAVNRFNGVLMASLSALLILLCAAALTQVAVGLAPLRALQRGVTAVHEGRTARLEGPYPAEVQPLIDHFNDVLDRNTEVVLRARTQAGNLAHAIKTPLAALSQAASVASGQGAAAAELAGVVEEQVNVARRHVDWHLARARAAAAQGLPGAHVALPPVIDGLLRVMSRVHAGRNLRLLREPEDAGLAFAGEVQDLQEILGNLLDNACKWARHEVRIASSMIPGEGRRRLHIVIDDDGPGIDADRRETVMARGARLDESVPGSGLGLAIVQELVGLYGGSVTLGEASSGGLRVGLELPAA